MRIDHPAAVSPVYELVKTAEVDLQIGETSWTARIELFRDTEQPNRFRYRSREFEHFRLVPTFPMDADGKPQHTSDDYLLVDRTMPHVPIAAGEAFDAPDAESAFDLVLGFIRSFLAHTIGSD